MKGMAGVCIWGATVMLLVGGCGDSTTTIIERTGTVEQEPAKPRPSAGNASSGSPLLKLPAYEHWAIEPRIYSFGVSGAFAGHDLTWRGWGSATARGVGRIWERNPDGDFSDYRKYPGEVVATGLERCKGREFYTEVVAQAEGLGTEPVQLATPCTGGAPLDPDAVTGRSGGG